MVTDLLHCNRFTDKRTYFYRVDLNRREIEPSNHDPYYCIQSSFKFDTFFERTFNMSFETVKNVRLQKVPDRLNVNYLQTEG